MSRAGSNLCRDESSPTASPTAADRAQESADSFADRAQESAESCESPSPCDSCRQLRDRVPRVDRLTARELAESADGGPLTVSRRLPTARASRRTAGAQPEHRRGSGEGPARVRRGSGDGPLAPRRLLREPPWLRCWSLVGRRPPGADRVLRCSRGASGSRRLVPGRCADRRRSTSCPLC